MPKRQGIRLLARSSRILEWIGRGMPETPEQLAGIICTLYYRRNFE